MNRLFISIVAMVVLIAIPTMVFAAHDGTATGKAKMHPENQSGVKGLINFVDNGSGVDVTGAATGMDPTKTLISLVYDDASVSGGPLGCEPRGGFLPGMLIGLWVVDGDGNGTLNGTNGNDLGTFKTVSIRDANGGLNGNGRGPEAVVACGQVAVHPAG